MKINHLAFDKFYEIILEHFRKKELTEKQRKSCSPKSAENWTMDIDKTMGVFGQYSRDARLLYRRRGEIRTNKPEDGEIEDDLFIACLKYIGIEIPEAVNIAEIADDEKKVQVYYQYFLSKHYPEYLAKYPDFNVFNEKTGKLKFIAANSKANSMRLGFSMNENEIYATMNIDIVKTVNDFYQYISATEYEQAWNLIAKSMQHRVWKDKLDSFSIGYTNCLSVNNVHIWDVKIEDRVANCKVYYEDVIQSYTTMELGNIEKLTIGNSEEFFRRINAIKEKASKTSLVDFDKQVEIQKFFDPAHSEYIWYKCGMNPEAIKELYESEAVLSIPRLYNITLGKEDNVWLIKAITSIKNSMYR